MDRIHYNRNMKTRLENPQDDFYEEGLETMLNAFSVRPQYLKGGSAQLFKIVE